LGYREPRHPKIMTSLSTDLNQIQWVLIVYMIDLHLDRNPTYATAILVGGSLNFGLYSLGLLVMLFLQDVLEYTALQAATLLFVAVASLCIPGGTGTKL
jgi:hypothetical protein